MAPLLARIGTVFVYTYGAFLVLGFLWGCFLLWKHIRISKFAEDLAFDIGFLSFAGALVAGRLFFGLLHFKEFGLNIVHYILVNGYPGMSVVGMIFGWFAVMYIATSQNKVRFDEYVDYSTPSIFIFYILAMAGSFFAGMEPGIRWGWYQHPLALYRVIVGVIGLAISVKLLFAIRKEQMDKGFSAVFFVWLFSLSQIALHPLKDARVLLTESTVEYWAYVIMLLTSSFYIVYYFRVFLGRWFKSVINWKASYVKTVKDFSHKTKKPDRGGAEENSKSD
jgi:prolipoprotein diacylglyceryltransferase